MGVGRNAGGETDKEGLEEVFGKGDGLDEVEEEEEYVAEEDTCAKLRQKLLGPFIAEERVGDDDMQGIRVAVAG